MVPDRMCEQLASGFKTKTHQNQSDTDHFLINVLRQNGSLHTNSAKVQSWFPLVPVGLLKVDV